MSRVWIRYKSYYKRTKRWGKTKEIVPYGKRCVGASFISFGRIEIRLCLKRIKTRLRTGFLNFKERCSSGLREETKRGRWSGGIGW